MALHRYACWTLAILIAATAASAGEPDNAEAARQAQELRQRYERYADGLKQQYDLHSFTVVIEPPFVVVGDEPPAKVREHSIATVRWFCAQMRSLYFAKDPEVIHTVWLFKDDASYRTHAKDFFDSEADTPFGWFSQAHGLIMNIQTGGGTLCHEIVHAYMRANFPACPDWFNEGLASLYEQCGERNKRAVGLVNWRLGGLQKTLGQKGLPSFEELCTRIPFYGEMSGRNYAMARYLCLWLQEQGKLVDFWRAAVSGAKDDPNCYRTLAAVIGGDMAVWQKRWEAWVLNLRFPERR